MFSNLFLSFCRYLLYCYFPSVLCFFSPFLLSYFVSLIKYFYFFSFFISSVPYLRSSVHFSYFLSHVYQKRQCFGMLCTRKLLTSTVFYSHFMILYNRTGTSHLKLIKYLVAITLLLNCLPNYRNY